MGAVLDIRGMEAVEARELLGQRLNEVDLCDEVLCIASSEDPARPWQGLKLLGDVVTWRPLVVEPDRVLLTLQRSRCSPPFDPTILAFMKADHRRILMLVDEVAESAEAGLAMHTETYLDLLVGLIRRHMEVEESLLIPVLSVRHGGQRGPASVLRDDHISIVNELDELSTELTTPGALANLARRARALKDLLDEHTILEEDLVYRLADKHLDDEERASLLDFCRAMA